MEYEGLCNYACILLKNEGLAEDIVQEAFIRIWDNRKNLVIYSSWKAYIYRTVHNCCINCLKKKDTLSRKNSQFQEEVFYHNQISITRINPEAIDRLVAEELSERIEDVITSFPRQCREIFILSRYEQMAYADIADHLNISVNTVKTQIKRALKKLKQVI